MDKEAAKLIEGLKHEDWRVRLKSASALGDVRLEEAVHALISALDDEHELVRNEVIPALGNIGSLAKEAVLDLITRLPKADKALQKSIVYTLGKIGPAASKAISPLIAELRTADADFRTAISWALGIIAMEQVPALLVGLTSDSPGVRAGVVEALGRVGVEGELTVPGLIPLLKDPEVDVRIATAKALGNLRALKKTEDAVPFLIECLKDEDPEVCWLASESLRKIGTPAAMEAWANFEPEGSVPKLIKQLRNRDKSIRADAAKGLRDLGAEASDAVEAMASALKDQMWNVKAFCAEGLGRIGPKAAEATMSLVRALSDEDVRVRKPAATALGKIGPEAKEAVEALILALKDSAKEVRHAAAVALEEIGTPEAKTAANNYDWE